MITEKHSDIISCSGLAERNPPNGGIIAPFYRRDLSVIGFLVLIAESVHGRPVVGTVFSAAVQFADLSAVPIPDIFPVWLPDAEDAWIASCR